MGLLGRCMMEQQVVCKMALQAHNWVWVDCMLAW